MKCHFVGKTQLNNETNLYCCKDFESDQKCRKISLLVCTKVMLKNEIYYCTYSILHKKYYNMHLFFTVRLCTFCNV